MLEKIIICGAQRTGSTWAYNVARIALEKVYDKISAGYGEKNYNPNLVSLIKIHHFNDQIAKNAIVISTIRDPRDMAASAIRIGIANDFASFLEQQQENYRKWKPLVNVEIRYEESPLQKATKIIHAIGLNIDPKVILSEVNQIKLPKHHDRITQLWPNHITDGGYCTYNKTISGMDIENIEDRFANFIEECGYKLHEYLFVVAPNNSGSTVLYCLLSTSPAASILKSNNMIAEGFSPVLHLTPIPNKGEAFIFTKSKEKLSLRKNYNWGEVKNCWYKHWDLSKNILIEKSPTSVYRMDILKEQFPRSKFIVMVRNPYCVCEGIKRKGENLKDAAYHWNGVAKQQIENSKMSNTLTFRYEDMAENIDRICKNIIDFCPELISLDYQREFKVPRYEKVQGIQTQNRESLKRLGASEYEELNRYLDLSVMKYWGYTMIKNIKLV